MLIIGNDNDIAKETALEECSGWWAVFDLFTPKGPVMTFLLCRLCGHWTLNFIYYAVVIWAAQVKAAIYINNWHKSIKRFTWIYIGLR